MKKSTLMIMAVLSLTIGAGAQSQRGVVVQKEREHKGASHTSTTYKPKPGVPAPVERHTVTRWRYHKGYKRAGDQSQETQVKQGMRNSENAKVLK